MALLNVAPRTDVADSEKTQMCAWDPSNRKEWCRGNSKSWAPTVLDIIEEANSNRFTGFGVHIDVLSGSFLKCAIESNIDDEHVAEMHVECAETSGILSPFGTGMVMGRMRHEIVGKGGVGATIMISGPKVGNTIIRPLKAEPNVFEVCECKTDKVMRADRSETVGLVARLVAEDGDIFYNFVVTTEDWTWQKRKGADSVLRALAKAIPSITHKIEDDETSIFVFPPMGPHTRPELGNVHVTLNRLPPNGGAEEIAWHSASVSTIKLDLNMRKELSPIFIQVITTW
jgi:hypothetical protein